MNNKVCDTYIYHNRQKPFKNYFSYNILSLFLDIKNIMKIKNKPYLFSINKLNFFSFYEKDHGPRKKGFNLYNFISKQIKKKFKDSSILDIYLLASPRFLGYVFNPISIYFCFKDKKIKYIIYEVKNTHHEQHTYYKKIKFNKTKHIIKKKFYVSPFLTMDMKYYFNIIIQKKSFKIYINTENNKSILRTGLITKNYLFNNKNLIFLGIKRLFYAQKIMIMIHFQAIKNLTKKARFYYKKNKLYNTLSFHE